MIIYPLLVVKSKPLILMFLSLRVKLATYYTLAIH